MSAGNGKPPAADVRRFRVLKFGGTSVSSAAALRSLAAIVARAARESRVLVVASACAGVTDELVMAARGASTGGFDVTAFVERLGRRHERLLREIASGRAVARAAQQIAERLAELRRVLHAVSQARACTPGQRDAVLASGERLSLPVVSVVLGEAGLTARPIDAAQLVRSDDRHGAAEADRAAIRGLVAAALQLLPAGVVPVTSGFVAASGTGATTTLGRGGSDYTAALLGEALDAERVEIWTDVDGVLSADPRLVASAFTLSRLSHAQAAALARGGAQVLHPKTMAPLQESGIPVLIRNTRRPHGRATWVGPGAPRAEGVLAVSTRVEGERARVSLLAGSGSPGLLAERAVDLLRRGAIPLLDLETRTDGPGEVVLSVPVGARERATTLLHDALVPRPQRVNVVVAGARGLVGRSLLRLLGERTLPGFHLCVVGAFQRECSVFSTDGFDPLSLPEALEAAEPVHWRRSLEHSLAPRARPLLLVDCTASAELAAEHHRLLASGVGVVTPNKHGRCLPLEALGRLEDAAREAGVPYLYAATVGAGLPVLRAVRELTGSGDGLRRVAGVVSGTLSYVLGRVQDGVAWSVAVEEARAKGFTEPDPRQDLAGTDVARKLLIVLREAGHALELHDVAAESLVPPGLRDGCTPAQLAFALRSQDGEWAERAESARRQGRRLAYLATWDGQQARVGVESLPEHEPLARARPGENVIALWTDRYAGVPLTIAGPGAGPDLTAANVLSDLREAASMLAGREPRAAERRRAGWPAPAGEGLAAGAGH